MQNGGWGPRFFSCFFRVFFNFFWSSATIFFLASHFVSHEICTLNSRFLHEKSPKNLSFSRIFPGFPGGFRGVFGGVFGAKISTLQVQNGGAHRPHFRGFLGVAGGRRGKSGATAAGKNPGSTPTFGQKSGFWSKKSSKIVEIYPVRAQRAIVKMLKSPKCTPGNTRGFWTFFPEKLPKIPEIYPQKHVPVTGKRLKHPLFSAPAPMSTPEFSENVQKI